MDKISKKLIVLIDDFLDSNEVVKMFLEEKGYEVATFSNFNDAKEFLNTHTPELILSDLIGHDNINGVEFYINEIMNRKWNFAIWTGCLSLADESTVRDFGVFLEGLPKDYRVTFDPKKALSQGEVDLIIQDYKNNTTSTFPVFSKPAELQKIMSYFNLKINSFMILYFGTLVEAGRLTVWKL